MYRKDLIKPDGRKLHLYSREKIADDIVATNPPHEPVTGRSHLRWHPLRGEWVAYASHRQNRTFLPPKEYSPLAVTSRTDFPTELPAGKYDMAVFENLFPSLSLGPEVETPTSSDASKTGADSDWKKTAPGKGICEVVVFSQDPDTSLASMTVEQVAFVLEVIGDRVKEIGSNAEIKYVLPFENRGVEVGVTLHHPHGQIYSYAMVPPLPAKMIEMQEAHFVKHGATLISDMIKSEEKETVRMIDSREHAAAFIPLCARYPYETWIAPRRPVQFLYELNPAERLDLARTLKTVLMKYDAMWNKPFPYLLALFQAPTDGSKHDGVHMHFQTFPPLRTADRLKYLAGTELAAGFYINDALPEEKAAELRAVKISLGESQ